MAWQVDDLVVFSSYGILWFMQYIINQGREQRVHDTETCCPVPWLGSGMGLVPGATWGWAHPTQRNSEQKSALLYSLFRQNYFGEENTFKKNEERVFKKKKKRLLMDHRASLGKRVSSVVLTEMVVADGRSCNEKGVKIGRKERRGRWNSFLYWGNEIPHRIKAIPFSFVTTNSLKQSITSSFQLREAHHPLPHIKEC